MSISNLLQSNNLELFSRSLNVKEMISDLLEANDIIVSGDFSALNAVVSGDLVANNILNNTGFNYLAPWSGVEKSYILNDLVIYNNQLWRCLVANTNIAPDPNDPAQAQWAAINSNNAILNEPQYAQVHLTRGNDQKALVSSTPFQTIDAAINYLIGVGGGVAKIMSVGQNNVYDDITLISANNIIVDGGDESNSYLNNPQNIFNGFMNWSNNNNILVKNLTVTSDTTIGRVLNSKNVCFQNVTFKDVSPNIITSSFRVGVDATVGATFGSCSFIDCNVQPVDNQTMDFYFSGPCDAGTIILFENCGLERNNSLTINLTAFGGITTPSDFTLIIKNSRVNIAGATFHTTGMNIILINCIISGTVLSNATSGQLSIMNCTFYDPVSLTWGGLQLTGSVPYLLVNVATNPNSTTDIIPTSPLNLTAGPAARFNRLVTWSPGIATSTGTTQAIVPVLPGAILANQFSIVTYNGGTGAINFTVPGVYQLLIGMDIANTNTANEQTVLNYWCGIAGSTEATSLATSSTDRGFVGSAGILATYPSSRRGLPLVLTVTSPATSYFFYVRSLSAAAYNVIIQTMAILQLR